MTYAKPRPRLLQTCQNCMGGTSNLVYCEACRRLIRAAALARDAADAGQDLTYAGLPMMNTKADRMRYRIITLRRKIEVLSRLLSLRYTHPTAYPDRPADAGWGC